MKSLYWLRNDMRIHDQKALLECCNTSESAIFVVAPTESIKRASQFRMQFFEESLADLDQSLIAEGQSLLRTSLRFPEFLRVFLEANSVDVVFYSEECSVEERSEEQEVLEICKKHQVQVKSCFQTLLINIEDLPFSLNEMPFVFTHFRKAIEANLKLRAPVGKPRKWPKEITEIKNLDQLHLVQNELIQRTSNQFKGGETSGLKRIQDYIWKTQSVQNYKNTRNGMLDFNDSTKFSPWLNLGCISAREIMRQVFEFESQVVKNESTYWVLFELLWRDYFKFFSLKYGSKIFELNGVSSKKRFECTEDPELFEKWSQGKLGVPFIDANMNELNQTGWMSNRGRQNVASFLIHQLKLPWIWGAAYFEKMLIDYDPDVNWGNWLYLSGQGSDPRSRQFNVDRQSGMYDPDGLYVKKWLS